MRRMYVNCRLNCTEDGRGTRAGCGGELTGRTGSFVSPNYPLPYGHSTECFWNVSVSRGSIIRLQFNDFQLETHSMCYYDFLEVSFLVAAA